MPTTRKPPGIWLRRGQAWLLAGAVTLMAIVPLAAGEAPPPPAEPATTSVEVSPPTVTVQNRQEPNPIVIRVRLQPIIRLRQRVVVHIHRDSEVVYLDPSLPEVTE